MPLYKYVCPSGHSTEGLRGRSVTSIPCPPPCCNDAVRLGVNSISFTMPAPPTEVKDKDGKTNVSRFMEASQEVAYGYEQTEKREGVKLKAPSAAHAGMREAKRRGVRMNV